MICIDTVARLTRDKLFAYYDAGLTRADAERDSGIPYATINNLITRNLKWPHPGTICKLRRWLQVPAYVLRGHDSYVPPIAAEKPRVRYVRSYQRRARIAA